MDVEHAILSEIPFSELGLAESKYTRLLISLIYILGNPNTSLSLPVHATKQVNQNGKSMHLIIHDFK